MDHNSRVESVAGKLGIGSQLIRIGLDLRLGRKQQGLNGCCILVKPSLADCKLVCNIQLQELFVCVMHVQSWDQLRWMSRKH